MNAQEYIRSLGDEFGWTQASHDLSSEFRQARIDALEKTGLFSSDQIANMRTDDSLPVDSRVVEFLERIGALVAAELIAMGYDSFRTPTIGLLETRDFNAWATTSPNGDPVCLMDRFLWGTLTLVGASLTEMLFEGSDGSSGNHQGAQVLLFAAMLQFARQHQSVAFEIIEKEFDGMAADPIRVFVAMQIVYGMLLFVVAHEFAHHALCHLPSHMSIPKGKTLKVYTRSQLDEFDADLLGYQVFTRIAGPSVESGTRRLFSQAEVAPILLVRFLALYDSTFAQTYEGASHPSWIERLNRLEEELQKDGHPNAISLNAVSCKLFKQLQNFTTNARAAIERNSHS